MPLVSEIGEFGLIERLRKLDIVQGIGDDCAVLTPPPGHDLVVTTDALIEGVHFKHDWTSWRRLGGKSIGVNLSDIAAMGAQPAGIVVTLGLKTDATVEAIEEFYAGASQRLMGTGCAIVGGDMVASPHSTTISVTAFGYVETGRAIRRSGARPGDEIWLTGFPGFSALGLFGLQSGADPKLTSVWTALYNRVPNHVQNARRLAVGGVVTAMMDVSDGLAGDLVHMADESGVAAILEEENLPVSPILRAYSRSLGVDSMDLVLYGGEDYELLFAASPGHEAEIRHAMTETKPKLKDCRYHVTRIGRFTDGSGLQLQRPSGSLMPLEAKGFRHF